MAEQSHSKKTYLVVYIALLALLVLTVATSFIDLGGGCNTAVAILIAFIKAILIIWFFMHLRFQQRLVWFFVGAGFLWLGIMLTLSMGDYLTRNHPPGMSPKGEPVFLDSARAPGEIP